MRVPKILVKAFEAPNVFVVAHLYNNDDTENPERSSREGTDQKDPLVRALIKSSFLMHIKNEEK